MTKLYVDVTAPGNGKIYEFRLDSSLTVGNAKEKMILEITDIENGNISLNPESAMLWSLNTRLRLAEGATLRAAGVKSGQKLLLL